MRFRLMMAAVAALSLIAAPAAAQGPPDGAGPPDDLPEQAQHAQDNRADQAEQGAGNAEGADERRVDDDHRAEQSDTRDERADDGAANAPQGQQNTAPQADDRAVDGQATSQDAREGGRDFGLDRAEERVDEHAPDDAEAGEALDRAREQGPDADAETGTAEAPAETGTARAGEVNSAFSAVTEALGNAGESAWSALRGVLDRLGELFGADGEDEA